MMNGKCLCGDSTSSREIIRYKDNRLFRNFLGITIVCCQNCGLLKTVYPEGFKKEKRKDFSQFYEKNKNEFIKLFFPLVELIERNIQGKKIIDVGCASGLLLSLLEKKGYQTFGIELESKSCQKAKKRLGKDIFCGKLSDYDKINKMKFDCVVYNHVLEHIEDVSSEIKLIKKHLTKNGILVIGVPNVRNVIFYLRQKYWESLLPDEHIWHFTDKYLIKYLSQFGFYLTDKYYSDDKRKDYPFFKRIYFAILSLINKFFGSGEAVVLVFGWRCRELNPGPRKH